MKRAVITGASSGIGRAFAERLAREGYDVVLVARRHERLESLAKHLRETCRVAADVQPADLTDPASLASIERSIRDDSSLELLVNNAGFGTLEAYGDADPDVEENEIRLNVLALARLTRAAIPGMVSRRRGAIINVSSIVALFPVPFFATYSSTKAYVNSFTESIHEELRGTGVRVQALCPGMTRTEFHQRAGIDTTDYSPKGMDPAVVVDVSLRALQRGKVVCIPGAVNRVSAWIIAWLPRALLRRVAAYRTRRLKKAQKA